MSVALFCIDRLLRLRMKRTFRREPNVFLLRAMMAELARVPSRMPGSIHLKRTALGGVVAERYALDGADDTRAVLYLHGGGMVGGSAASHRAILWRLAAQLGVPVWAPEYRLAPEHPFPAGLDDGFAAYRALLDAGIAPERLAVGGDSAGGNLTLALAHRLRARGLRQPAALFCFSPVTELHDDLPSRTANARTDAAFDPRLMASLRALYCGDADATLAEVSPLRGEVVGFPPTLLQCAEGELLRDDTVLLAERLRAAGVETQLQVVPKVFHAWQIAADFLPEGRAALDQTVAFLRPRLGLATPGR
jgi:acetyl esterase/lipase